MAARDLWVRSGSALVSGLVRGSRPLQADPFDLVLSEPLLGAVIELGGARTLMRGHRLRVFQRAAVGEIRRDPGRPERVVADRRHDAGGDRALAHHAPGIDLGHRLIGERGGAVPAAGAKQERFLIRRDAGDHHLREERSGSDEAGKFRFMWNNRERLQRIRRFILAVDDDAPGKRLADELIRRLLASRCLMVKYPEGCKKSPGGAATFYGADIMDDPSLHGDVPLPIVEASATPTEFPLGRAGVEFLESRKIDIEIAVRHLVHTVRADSDYKTNKLMVPDAKGTVLAFPYVDHGKIVSTKYRSTTTKKFWQSPGGAATFYGADIMDDPAFDGDQPLTIVEGEIDKLSVESAGNPFVVSVPEGASPPSKDHKLNEERSGSDEAGKFKFMWNNRERLKRIRRFILAVDDDAPGKRLADELIRASRFVSRSRAIAAIQTRSPSLARN
jgi:Toprim domain